MDVVVIGGGIVGLSAAHYLADRGADVSVFEKSSVGMGSTARSAGGIRSQFTTPVNVQLSLASKRVWNNFEADFGVDIDLRKNGYLFLARSDAVAARFRDQVAMQNDLGVDSEYLTPAEATEHVPGLLADRFVGATFNGDDGVADPNLAVQGYADAARDSGVDIHPTTGVEDLLQRGDRVTGVVTEAGRQAADAVVNAAGAWAARVGAMAGLELPIAPRRRQVAVVEPSAPIPEDHPLTIDLETGSYWRPERDGIGIVGGHFSNEDPDVDPDRYDENLDLEWAATAVESAADYTEYFGPEARIRRGWAGLYAVTPDHHPIIEASRPGLITAAGFSGHGFQHAPATGQIVADIVHEGESGLVDVSGLGRDRFARGEELLERNVA